MHDLHRVSLRGQIVGEPLPDRHRPMLAARTADADRQVALHLLLVLRHEVADEVVELPVERLVLRLLLEVGERLLIQTELNMIRSFDNLDREHRGYDTSLALLAVVQSLSYYPGRKTIVFFSEGLPVSPVLSAGLEHVIEAANRANVTAYAVDA